MATPSRLPLEALPRTREPAERFTRLTHPFPALEIGWLRVTIQALEPTTLRGFIGPALRGVLGDAMLDASVDGHGRAPFAPDSLLHTVFKPLRRPEHRADPTPPFIIDAPGQLDLHLEPGETLSFGLTLLNQALPRAIQLLWALYRYGERSALERARRGYPLEHPDPSQPGFTNLRRAFRLLEASCDTPSGAVRLFDAEGGPVPAGWDPAWSWTDEALVARLQPALGQPIRRIELSFETPLHLLQDGQPVRDLEFQHLVRSLLRHVQSHSSPTGFERLTLQDDGEFLRLADAVRLEDDRRLARRVIRGSRTQDRRIPIEATGGSLIFEGELEPFLPLLTLGTVLHVGKARNGGFGGFSWRVARRRRIVAIHPQRS